MVKHFFLKIINRWSSYLKYSIFTKKAKEKKEKIDMTLILYQHIIDTYPHFLYQEETSLVMRFYELNLCENEIQNKNLRMDFEKFPSFFLEHVLPILNKSIKQSLYYTTIRKKRNVPFYHIFFLIFHFLFQLRFYFYLNYYYLHSIFQREKHRNFFCSNYINFRKLIPDVYLLIKLIQSDLFSRFCKNVEKEPFFYSSHMKNSNEVVERWREKVNSEYDEVKIKQTEVLNYHWKRSLSKEDELSFIMVAYFTIIKEKQSECFYYASLLYLDSYLTFISLTNYDFDWNLNPFVQIILVQIKKRRFFYVFFIN